MNIQKVATGAELSPAQRAGALAGAVRGSSIVLEGSGHKPHARDPVKVNLLLRELIDVVERPSRKVQWPRGRSRTKRDSAPIEFELMHF